MPHNRTLLILLKNLVNPLLVMLVLLGTVWFYQGELQEGYFALLVLSFSLVVQFFDPVDFESNDKIFWKKTVVNLVVQWFWVISLVLVICFAFKMTDYFSRRVLITWILMIPGVLVTAHWVLRFTLRRCAYVENEMSRVIIVGLSELSHKLANEFKKNPFLGLSNVGFFDDRWTERILEYGQPPEKLLGNIASVAEFVKHNNIQSIYIALPMTSQPRIMALLDNLRDTTASIYFVPDIFLFDLFQAKYSTIKDILIVAVCESPFVGINGMIKRIMDVVFSFLILLLIAPLILLIVIGVKNSSPGPVLFKQRRYGLDGKKIVVYKFRTMTVMDDGGQVKQAIQNDPRITRFGGFLRKTSLDELPQFINVLQGSMSVVGPRPHAVCHNEMYRSLIKGYMMRHKVKPGITGWAQVNGCRGETDTLEKMQARVDYDLDYLRNWSIFLDLLIIIKTIGLVINEKNAY
jgi:putative colanic acid biosysnthesis UDP-glucose lipid carrier transferase